MTSSVPKGLRGPSRTVPPRRRAASATTERPMPRPERVSTAEAVEKPGSNTRARSASGPGSASGASRPRRAGGLGDGGEVRPAAVIVDADDEAPALHLDVEADGQGTRLAEAPARLGRLGPVAQGVAQGVQHRVLEDLEHPPVDGQVEAARGHRRCRGPPRGHGRAGPARNRRRRSRPGPGPGARPRRRPGVMAPSTEEARALRSPRQVGGIARQGEEAGLEGPQRRRLRLPIRGRRAGARRGGRGRRPGGQAGDAVGQHGLAPEGAGEFVRGPRQRLDRLRRHPQERLRGLGGRLGRCGFRSRSGGRGRLGGGGAGPAPSRLGQRGGLRIEGAVEGREGVVRHVRAGPSVSPAT